MKLEKVAKIHVIPLKFIDGSQDYIDYISYKKSTHLTHEEAVLKVIRERKK